MQATLPTARPSARLLRRNPFDFAAIFVILLAVSAVVVFTGWQFWHASRIYSGVTIDGVPVGGLTRAQARSELARTLLLQPLPVVVLYHGDRQWPLRADELAISADWLAAVNRAYLVGRQGDRAQRAVAQVDSLLRGRDLAPPLILDASRIRYALSQIASEVRRPGIAASTVAGVAVPGRSGLDVDVDATLDAVMAALHETPGTLGAPVPLAVVETTPPVANASAAAPAEETGRPMPTSLTLRNAETGLALALDAAELQQIVYSVDPVRMDEDALRSKLAQWAQPIDTPARDARLRFDPNTGSITVLQSSQAGRRLDVDATVAAVSSALATGSTEAPLVIARVAPAVDDSRVAEMGIRELVAAGSTYFAGSSAARVRNIEVAAEKLDGVVIPPDGIFSFNKLVEEVSSANGFEDSLIIWGDQTAVGVGGGVCQVSTTIFRAAYAAGLPVVERYNHGYIVDWYGEPGLDATIFTPSVDFRFRNDTGAYLLVQPVVDRANGVITFNLYGTRPDREVIIGEPVQSDVTQPPPPEYTVDESIAPGEQKQVEWEKPGMTVAVKRTITENGQTRTDTLTSHYQPWRAEYLVAPGTFIPTPTPTTSP